MLHNHSLLFVISYCNFLCELSVHTNRLYKLILCTFCQLSKVSVNFQKALDNLETFGSALVAEVYDEEDDDDDEEEQEVPEPNWVTFSQICFLTLSAFP